MSKLNDQAIAYKATLPIDNYGRTIWTIDRFAVITSIAYPHVKLVEGQEWEGVRSKYEFYCIKHKRTYTCRASSIMDPEKGSGCKDCAKEINLGLRGTTRRDATEEEKSYARYLRSEQGLTLQAIAKQLDRSVNTISCWINPKVKQRVEAASRKHRKTAKGLAQSRRNARLYHAAQRQKKSAAKKPTKIEALIPSGLEVCEVRVFVVEKN
mgnify:FL=1